MAADLRSAHAGLPEPSAELGSRQEMPDEAASEPGGELARGQLLEGGVAFHAERCGQVVNFCD